MKRILIVTLAILYSNSAGIILSNYCGLTICKSGYTCISNKCVSTQNLCTGVICPMNQVCNQGVCQSQSCLTFTCPTGTSCITGVCQPKLNVCPATSTYSVTTCLSPRPTSSNCPTLYYIRAPDPLYCGVKADGSRINFPRDC